MVPLSGTAVLRAMRRLYATPATLGRISEKNSTANVKIAENVDAATFAALRPRIDRLNALYRDVNEGDRYALTYLPGSGTELSYNGRPLGRVEGADFAAALFSIWLGDSPVDEGLKRSLLEDG